MTALRMGHHPSAILLAEFVLGVAPPFSLEYGVNKPGLKNMEAALCLSGLS